MKLWWKTAAVFMLFALVPAARGQEAYEFIPIIKQATRTRVAVPDFRAVSQLPGDDPGPARLTQFLRDTVAMTGLFELVPPASYPGTVLPGEKENLAAWRLINADLLIRGDLSRLSRNRYQVEIRCYDLKQGTMVLGKRYTGGPELMNRMVLRYMDELIQWLTGKKSALDSRIAYVSDQTGRNEVRIMDTDGGNSQAVTTNHTLNLSPAWSPDGRYLLYVGYRDRNPDLYIRDMDGTKDTKFYSSTGLNIAGDFSPDGRWIAFCREDQYGNVDVYVISREGRDLRRITASPAIEVSPTWSPDGKLMAFVSDRAGTPQLYLLDLTRGSEGPNNPAMRLTYDGSYNTSPAWSPDGRYIAYTGRVGGQFDLYLIEMSGQGKPVKRLTATAANEEGPAWSPDGRFLVYDSNESGNYDIYIRSIYGGTPRRITSLAAKERMPAWSPRSEP
jgi:TolB protein